LVSIGIGSNGSRRDGQENTSRKSRESAMKSRSLFARFFMSYLWITTTLVVLMGLYGCYLMRQFYLDQLAIDLEARARLCAKQIAVPLDAGDSAAVDALCKELGNLMSTRITVILGSGKVVGDTEESPEKMENHSDRPEVRAAMAKGIGIATHFSRTLKEERMYVAVAMKPDTPTKTLVRMSVTVPGINKTLAALFHDFLVGGLVIAALVTAVSLWISLRISRSLEAMMANTDHVARRDLGHRFPDLDSEEIAELTEAMQRSAEQMAAQIREARREGRQS
jgi:two-component system phosphate regulon sensor histidine kinase PhoR